MNSEPRMKFLKLTSVEGRTMYVSPGSVHFFVESGDLTEVNIAGTPFLVRERYLDILYVLMKYNGVEVITPALAE